MLESQKLSITLSEQRSAINALLGQESLDTKQSELDGLIKKQQETEVRYRAALVTEDGQTVAAGPDAESRERLELRSKARLSSWVAAALEGRGVQGAEAEYAAAEKVSPASIPLALFEPDPRIEKRAVTPAPSTAPVTSTRPTVPAIFERSVAASLGVAMPLVPAGQANFPALTTAPPASALAKDGSAPATAAAFTLTNRNPKRVAGQFEVRVEDIAIMPSIESDLRMAVQSAISDKLDEQVIAGNNTSPNLNGLFAQASDVSAEGTKATFATGLALFAALVDGKHAYSWADMRAIIGSATFGLFASLFQSNGDISLYDYLAGKLGSLTVSDRVPAKASNAQKALVTLNAGRQPITVPVWSAMSLIVDPYSGAGEGKRTITATALVSDPFIPYTTSQVKELHPKIS